MKSKGNKLASKQKEIRQSVQVLVGEHPGLAKTASGQASGASANTAPGQASEASANTASAQASEASANTASGQANEANALVVSLYEAASNAEATITEYTCIYVAMVTRSNPKLEEPGHVGQNIRMAVASALVTLKANRRANIFKDEVDEIQESLDKAVGHTRT